VFLAIGLDPRRHFDLLPGNQSLPDGLRLNVVAWFVVTMIVCLLIAARYGQLDFYVDGKVEGGPSSIAVLGLIIVAGIFLFRWQGTRIRR